VVERLLAKEEAAGSKPVSRSPYPYVAFMRAWNGYFLLALVSSLFIYWIGGEPCQKERLLSQIPLKLLNYYEK
jgi:hypothetical protein